MLRKAGVRSWFVVLLLSYWLSFMIYAVVISCWCNDRDTTAPYYMQSFITLSIVVMVGGNFLLLLWLALHDIWR